MASTSTINQWINDLASSLLPKTSSNVDRKSRRVRENFRKRVRHHNFLRTNQFEVRDKLIGLEEKFQVLNRDDLSDALYERRLELREHHERWVPDVLDLLLYLSDNPLRNTKLDELGAISDTSGIPSVLRWVDIEADDPLDRRDPIWQVPDFSDLSSDEDEVVSSTASTSPASGKQAQGTTLDTSLKSAVTFQPLDLAQVQPALQALLVPSEPSSRLLSEIELIKDVLLMAQGYPLRAFPTHEHGVLLDGHIELRHASNQTLKALFEQLVNLRNDFDVIKKWLKQQGLPPYLETAKEAVDSVIQVYTSSLCTFEERILHPKALQVVSLLKVVSDLEELGQPLAILSKWVRNVSSSNPLQNLEYLYELICEHHFTNFTLGFQVLLPVFINAFEVYLRPVLAWLQSGVISSTNQPFFVHFRESANASNADLWNHWFELETNEPQRAPNFLDDVVHDIYTCGKTVCFIRNIEGTKSNSLEKLVLAEDFMFKIRSLLSDPILPFPAGFLDVLQTHFADLLASRTLILRALLNSKCGMTDAMDAFEYIYLRNQGALLDTIESRIFTRIDVCMDNWNDRFLISDMLEDVYSNIKCVDVQSIIVHSAHTSSRSMESRRRSVRILGALALDYALPWPVANIIPKESLAAYRRVALHLLQIRRAKYVLERWAYTHAHSFPISHDPSDQLAAQTTTFMLIQFVNTLYDHFTTGVSLPLTTKMRKDLSSASTVDAMITVHKTYITNLEFACLTSKQLKMLRDTLIGLLDMCIRFSDLLSSSDAASNLRRGSDEFESGSFVSAKSHRRGRPKTEREDAHGSSEDEDDEFGNAGEGEGYSSFIVLGEDTSVVQEIRKLQVQFRRQLDFFVAGLRGVARGGGTVDEFEMLADRLEWKAKS